MKQLTIRKVSSELATALSSESRLKNQSINQTVLDLLHQVLGLGVQGGTDNGLSNLAGTWTEDEFLEFNKNTAMFEELDPELWEP